VLTSSETSRSWRAFRRRYALTGSSKLSPADAGTQCRSQPSSKLVATGRALRAEFKTPGQARQQGFKWFVVLQLLSRPPKISSTAKGAHLASGEGLQPSSPGGGGGGGPKNFFSGGWGGAPAPPQSR